MFCEITEMESAEDGRNNKLDHGGPSHAEPVQTENGNDWKLVLSDMFYEYKYLSKSDFKKFFEKYPTANPSAALHVLATTPGRSFSDSNASDFKKYFGMINMIDEILGIIDKIEDLLVKDEKDNTLLSNAARHGKEDMVFSLISKNEELLDNRKNKNYYKDHLLTIPNADGRIPVQLACERGNEDITKYLYKKTPSYFLHPDNGDYGSHLLTDCITKKMFDIALHLLCQIPKLTFHKCQCHDTTILPTLAQFSESPFSSENQLAFWNRWLYHCINFEVKLKPSKESANDRDESREIGFDVYARILGIRWRNWSLFKTAASSIQADQQERDEQADKQPVIEANQQQERDEQADKQPVIEATQQQESDVEANWQAAQEKDSNGVGIKIRRVFKSLGMVLLALGFDLLLKFCALMYLLLFLPVVSFLEKLSSLIGFEKICDLKMNHVLINEILKVISKQLNGLSSKELLQNGARDVAFLAIKNHIPEIVKEFTKANENLLWSSFDSHNPESNMLAMTVIHRQEKVAKYLHELGIKNATNIMDRNGNNMLHLAAKLAPRAHLAHISGAALQLQSELRWFKGVEGIVPSFQKDSKNKKKKIPFELFATEHEKLMREAEEWLKKASESSTVVGALIITIMFTAAFTVPGGNNQETGLPIFSRKPPFLIFIIADAVSLFAASTSVLMFLGILTSRYALVDFMKSLLMKLILGLSSLFVSIAAMMAAFCAALFIKLQGQLEVVVPVTLLAGIPVTSFVLLQFPLLVEILKSTYSSDIFMKKKDSRRYELLCFIFSFELLKDVWDELLSSCRC